MMSTAWWPCLFAFQFMAVSQVKDMGLRSLFEGDWSIAIGKLLTLSERQLVDCVTVDPACHGGLMSNGFAFAEKERHVHRKQV